jgi:beta-glucanase (GH16 family)
VRSALVVVVTIVLVALGMGAAPAATPDITLRVSASSAVPHRVLVTGRVLGRERVVTIQRHAHGRWVRERTVRLGKRHRFSTLLVARAGVHRYRAVTRHDRSAARAVRVTATPTSAPASTPSDACGARPTNPAGSLWSCTFADDFNGSTLDRNRWTVATNYATGNPTGIYACAADDPSLVSVEGGHLDLSLRRLDVAVPCGAVAVGGSTQYLAGTVSTLNHFSQKYGRFEAKIRAAASTAPGLTEAFWMWPVNAEGKSWPASGEIDIAETFSVYPHRYFPRLHSGVDADAPEEGVNTASNCLAERGVWNTYTLEWSPTRMDFFVNGKLCLRSWPFDPAFQKAYVPILTQGIGASWNPYDGRAPMPATMNVDYMRVWQ